MKQCAHCREWKEIEEFAYNNRLLGTRQKHCRSCMSKFNKESYNRRPDEYRQKVYENRAKRTLTAKEYVWDYLSNHPCVSCGERDPRLLEFHHRDPSNKEYNVSELINGRFSIERIQKEIDKCEVLCVKCHRIRTYEDKGWYTR